MEIVTTLSDLLSILLALLTLLAAVVGFIGLRIFKAIDLISDRLGGIDKEVAVLVYRSHTLSTDNARD